MKIVIKVLMFVSFVMVCSSCNNPKKLYAVDYEAEEMEVKVEIGNGDPTLYEDTHGKNYIRLKEELLLDSIVFVGPDKYFKAASYLKKHPDLDNKARLVKTVSILDKRRRYIKAFTFSNPTVIDLQHGTITNTALDMKIDYAPVWHGNELNECLKLEFTQTDNGKGYKKWTLSYGYKNAEWLLISRERVNSIKNDVDPFGYCLDTINANISPKRANAIFITNDLLYDLKCSN